MKRLLLIVSVAFLALFGCEQDYLVDGGLADPQVGTSTFDYLSSHDQLDTLAILIERAGMVDQVNSDGTTLFAPNNLAIKNYVNGRLAEMRETDPQAQFTVDDISQDTLEKYMGGYIFAEQIKREDLTEEGTIYTAANGEERRISLEPVPGDYSGELSSPPEYVNYTYKGGSDWDPWDQIDDDTRIRVRTSNLVSTNGTIHVLQGYHTLFNWEDPDN